MTPFRLWVLLFVLVVSSHWAFLDTPAGHDATWSVVAGAETLAGSGFDVANLLKQPGFSEGGPSTHGSSPITLLTAVMIRLVGDPRDALIFLHLIHMAFGASGLWYIYRLTADTVGDWGAILVTVATAVTPTVFTQIGDIYLETPLMMSAVGALWYWSNDRVVPASALALLAVLIKGSGAAVAATIVIATAYTRRSRVATAVALAALSLSLLVAAAVTSPTPTGHAFSYDFMARFWNSQWLFLLMTPLTVLLAGAHVLSTAAWLASRCRSTSLGLCVVFPWIYIGQHVAGPILGQPTNLLPRYWVVAIPLMLISATWWMSRRFSLAGALTGAAAYLVVASLGLFGSLLPGRQIPDFILAERSPLSRQLIELEQAAIAEMLARDAVILAGLDTSFRLTYPSAGFVEKPTENYVRVPTDTSLQPDADHVVFLQRDAARHTTLRLEDLAGEWETTETPVRNGPFEVIIVEARRR